MKSGSSVLRSTSAPVGSGALPPRSAKAPIALATRTATSGPTTKGRTTNFVTRFMESEQYGTAWDQPQHSPCDLHVCSLRRRVLATFR